MPRAIKKKPAKKKPVPEKEVKSAALHALETLRKRQKQAVFAASAVVAVIILYVVYALYSSSVARKAYALETEAYKYYYVTGEKALTGKDRWKRALELFQESVDIRPTPTALFYLGNCYFNLGEFDKAITQYNAFIDRFSSNREILPLVYQKLASAYFRTNRNDKALETLARLAELQDGAFRDTALVIEARYYERAGENAKALEKYRELSAEFPSSPWSAEAASKIAAAEGGKAAKAGEAGNAPATEADTADKRDTSRPGGQGRKKP